MLSPDGAEIAFLRMVFAHELWTMPTVGGEARVRFAIGNDEGFWALAWSPDGKSIAYIRAFQSSGHPGHPGILETRNLENGIRRLLLSDVSLLGGGTNNISWLPGDRMVFGLYKGSLTDTDLWGISLDANGSPAGKPVRLTSTTGLYIANLSASTDGKRLAILFSRQSFSLFIANLNKTGDKLEQPLRITNDYWNSFPGCWTANSQRLFYEVSRSDQGQNKGSIYKRDISSESADVFLTGSDSYDAWSLSPDGAWVIAIANRRVPGKSRLLRIPSSGGTPETIFQLAGMAQVDCASAGSRICILSEDIGKQQVFSSFDPVRGRGEEVARTDDLNAYQVWSLSPDGRRIALVQNLSDNVRVLDLQSKQLQVLHPLPSQEGLQIPAWSADGKKIFLSGSNDNNEGILLEMDLSGHTHLLLKNPWSWIGAPRPSPDGKRIAYTYGVGESNVTLLEHF